MIWAFGAVVSTALILFCYLEGAFRQDDDDDDGGDGGKAPVITAGMSLQSLVDSGIRIAMLVGHSGKRYSPSYEVSAIALSNTHDQVAEIEHLIFTFGNDGFGRASDDLYVSFVGDPYLRLFQLEKPVGASLYDRALKIGSVVEFKHGDAPFRIGPNLRQDYMRLTFVSNSALDKNWDYKLGETKRGDSWISIYVPRYKSASIPCYDMTGPSSAALGSYGGSYEPSAPPLPDYWHSSSNAWYPASSVFGDKPTIKYEQSLKQMYSNGLKVSLVFAPTDEAAAWMPGEPFPLTAFAVPSDYSTVEAVFDYIDAIPNLVPGVRFITIKGDPQGRLFQVKKLGGEWVIDRLQDKSTTGAPFELVDRLRQGDPRHAYFAYDEIKFVPWYTAEKGRTWAAYVGGSTVPVSFPKGMTYSAVEALFIIPI
ncbi:hypothetical protein SeMB42_g00196 [Synchytrium endobioticum]|uniref:Uncharacterized protein n=1 Tax=Synchytrium endobioticum TaxID=286115 RepID=A0A507CN47_9FUNG|nr:hypothetical protein SeLEV6574_g06556 [Synchytrium endobioticum]TPX54620.1 hypothetical protein SeMB42_g00196 [Synchytrium endobioticum]